MFEDILVNAGAGALGQTCRVVLGLKKALDAGEPLVYRRLVLSIGYALLWGAMVGAWVHDPRLAFTTGLAATDLTESLIKVASSAKK